MTVNSAIKKTTNPVKASARQLRMKLDDQPPVFQDALPLVSASIKEVKNTPKAKKPMISNERIFSVLYSLWIRIVAKMAIIPTGTLTSKMVCQAKWSIK